MSAHLATRNSHELVKIVRAPPWACAAAPRLESLVEQWARGVAPARLCAVLSVRARQIPRAAPVAEAPHATILSARHRRRGEGLRSENKRRSGHGDAEQRLHQTAVQSVLSDSVRYYEVYIFATLHSGASGGVHYYEALRYGCTRAAHERSKTGSMTLQKQNGLLQLAVKAKHMHIHQHENPCDQALQSSSLPLHEAVIDDVATPPPGIVQSFIAASHRMVHCSTKPAHTPFWHSTPPAIWPRTTPL